MRSILPTMIEKIAEGQARFDGRSLMSMSRSDRERYLQRARLALDEMSDPSDTMIEAFNRSVLLWLGEECAIDDIFTNWVNAAIDDIPDEPAS